MWNNLWRIVALFYAAQIDELTTEGQYKMFLRAALEEDRAQFEKRFGTELVAQLDMGD